MTGIRRLAALLTLALVSSTVAVSAGDKRLEAFARDWEGRRVVLKSSLYTLVYNETGRLGGTRRGKVEGLTVTTPVSGTYYRFSGRQGVEEIVDRNPSQLVDRIAARYKRSKHLDIGSVSIVEPVRLVQYSDGVELVVQSLDVDRASIRLVFQKHESGAKSPIATSLTIQWPTALSNEFTERDMVEAFLRQFVDVM